MNAGWLAIATVSIAIGSGLAAHPETPVPLAACSVGGVRITDFTKGGQVVAKLRRMFPRADVISMGSGRSNRSVLFREGGQTILNVESIGDDNLLWIDLLSPRFQLAPGVYPGASLAEVERALGAVTVERDPHPGGDEELTFQHAETRLGWGKAGCTLTFKPGPMRQVGVYRGGNVDTHRYRSGAYIRSIEIAR